MNQTDASEPTDTPSLAAQRAAFNSGPAEAVARSLDLPPRITGKGYSDRFAFFADEHQLGIVAGPQEGDHVELALAHAVRHANGRATTLVLPDGHSNATAQRIPWLKPSARPALHVHRDGEVIACPERTQPDTVQAVQDRLSDDLADDELTDAMTPLHLDAATDGVWRLVEHVTRDHRLDHGHRRGERSWHFAGQRLLSIRPSSSGTVIAAGIHYSGKNAPTPLVLQPGEELVDAQFDDILDAIEHAISERRAGAPPIHRPDEHWLQAIIRRDPILVGVEQPALREVPAWRPRDSARAWGRGYIDLLGLNGHGDVRIVETKLADNADDLLVLQGLDYYVWAQAYERALRARLGASAKARFELHYVLGASGNTGKVKISPCTKPLADTLDTPAVRWRFQTVHDWFHAPDEPGNTRATLLDPGEGPSE